MNPSLRGVMGVLSVLFIGTGTQSAFGHPAGAPAPAASTLSKTSPTAATEMYDITNAGQSSYAASNAAHGMLLEFSSIEATLKYSGVSGGFRLTGYGYGQRLLAPKAARLQSSGNRIEYQRGELTEWYVNEAEHVEQGFTFAQRPDAGQAGDPLILELAVTGGLRPVLTPDGSAILLEAAGHDALRYDALRSWDANGRELPSRLEVDGNQIRLLVDDREAQYPLIVDPAVTATTTTLTSSANPSLFGSEITLHAVVTPSAGITGRVTFYDGVVVIGVAPVSGGTTNLKTLLLSAGAHSLTARYDGDATYLPSPSSAVSQ